MRNTDESRQAHLTSRGSPAARVAVHHVLRAAARRRVRALRDDGERGAQAAEYAMLGGVSAAACGCLIVVLNSSQGRFGGFLDLVFSVMGRFIRGWL